MRDLKKKINKSLIRTCHTNRLGFHPPFYPGYCRMQFFFLLVTILSPLLFFLAGKTTGNSLFGAVGYMEYGVVTGRNGYWQIPDSSS